MSLTLAFDVYGTLIDTHGVLTKLQELMGDQAGSFSQSWREKQLEYSFRRGLMKRYETFAVCTAQALDYTCSYYKVSLTAEQKNELLAIYRVLPAFADVENSLGQLKTTNHQLYAFSNGSAEAVETLLGAAGISDYFHGVVSVDDIQSFKPDPAVYNHLLNKTEATASKTWLISSNPFDVIGARNAGMNAAWVQRSKEAIYDPWGIEPTMIVSGLDELTNNIG